MCATTFAFCVLVFRVVYAKIGALRGAMLKKVGEGWTTLLDAQALPCRSERGPQVVLLIHVFADLVLL